MARIRTVKPEFWDDLKISKISRDSRLLYIGMWNFADDLGVIIGDALWIKSKIFPFDQIQIQQFEKWLQELVKNGFISLFSHKGEKFYYLPNLTRHQVINRPNLDKVNLKKTDLEIVINSLINHGTFTDNSYSGVEKIEERKIEDTLPLPFPKVKPDNECESISWRNNFKIYLESLRKAFVELTEDIIYISERERYHPGIDIKVSLEKACKDYWALEAGWKKKKSSKINEIDWKSTFNNALDLKSNQVWKSKEQKDKENEENTRVHKVNR